MVDRNGPEAPMETVVETAIADMAFRSQQEQYPPRKPTARMAYKACDYTSSLMPRVGGRASDPYLLQQSA